MMKSGPRSPQLEKALAQKRRPNTDKNKVNNKINKIKLKIFKRLKKKRLINKRGLVAKRANK